MKKVAFNLGQITWLWVLVGIGIVLNAVLWILVTTTFPKDSPAAVLHYSVGVGIDFIGPGGQIYALPSIGTALLVANTALAYILAAVSRRAVWVFIGIIPFIQTILLAAYLMLWRLN